MKQKLNGLHRLNYKVYKNKYRNERYTPIGESQ